MPFLLPNQQHQSIEGQYTNAQNLASKTLNLQLNLLAQLMLRLSPETARHSTPAAMQLHNRYRQL